MLGQSMVLSQLWLDRVPHSATLYAFSFWSSSYTLVATVWRFSPSQSLGFFSVGLRRCKEGTSLSHYFESALEISLGAVRGGKLVRDSLEPGLHVFSKRAEVPARFRAPRWAGWGLAISRDSAIETSHTDPCLSAQN